MQCSYCTRQSYITHICPYCKEYYCLEHRDPDGHGCSAYQELNRPQTSYSPRPRQTIRPKTEKKVLTDGMRLQKNMFFGTFVLVVFEEMLRMISYTRNSPFFELNVYVAMVAQWLTPYLAAPIIFLLTCSILFVTRSFSRSRLTNGENMNFLRTAIPVGIYTSIAIIYVFSAASWLLMLLT